MPPCSHYWNGTLPTCGPYIDTPKCVEECRQGYGVEYEADKKFGNSSYGILPNVEDIQREIMENGPVVAAFTVYKDFYAYKSGVYHHVAGEDVGAHAVKMMGWGVENGTPYWLIANSWNSEWGDKGFFKILRGKNEVDIESDIVAGLPKLN